MTDLDFTADRSPAFEAGRAAGSNSAGPYRERRVALARARGDEEVEAALHSDARKISSKTWACPKTTSPKWTNARTPPIRSSSMARSGSTA